MLDEAYRLELMILFTAAESEPDFSDCALPAPTAELFCSLMESLDCCTLFEVSLFSLIAKLVALFVLSGLPVPPPPCPTELF